MFADNVAHALFAVPHHAVRRNVPHIEHAGIVATGIVHQTDLSLRTHLERLTLHAILQGFRLPPLDSVEGRCIDIPAVLPDVRILMVEVVEEPERLRNVGDAGDMVCMPVGDHQVVDLALRDETPDVAANPLAGAPLPRWSWRDRLCVAWAAPFHVSAVEQHRGAVGEDEERVLRGAGVNEVDVHLPRLPAGIRRSDTA